MLMKVKFFASILSISVPQTIISLCLSHPSRLSEFHFLPAPPWYSHGQPVCCSSVWTPPEESLSRLQTVRHKAEHLTPSRSLQHVFLLPLQLKKKTLFRIREACLLVQHCFEGLLLCCACSAFYQGVSWIGDAQVCFWPCLKPGLEIYMAL